MKVASIRRLLPDATYSTWKRLATALKEAVESPIQEPVVPASVFEAYRDRPLPSKLGIKPGSSVRLADAPTGFKENLIQLSAGVRFVRQPGVAADLVIWFVRTRAELLAKIKSMKAIVGDGRVWIAWPKKATNPTTDLDQTAVREAGLGAGLVDYKICSIDDRWSGLLFTRRPDRRGKKRAPRPSG